MKNLVSQTSAALRTLRSKGLVLGCAAALPLALGMAKDDPPIGGGFGMSDPTVGTLPMVGPSGGEFDQTITLRGETTLLRRTIVDADGDGFVEVIDLGDGTAWARFYGDVRVEISAEMLPSITVGLYAGFEGSGMHYAIGGDHGFGTPRSLESGFELPLDLGRALSGGLLDSPLHLHAIHREGTRTTTTFEVGVDDSTVVIHQDV